MLTVATENGQTQLGLLFMYELIGAYHMGVILLWTNGVNCSTFYKVVFFYILVETLVLRTLSRSSPQFTHVVNEVLLISPQPGIAWLFRNK